MGIEHIIGGEARLEALKRKLAAREGKAEFKENVVALKAEIERLEALASSNKSG